MLWAWLLIPPFLQDTTWGVGVSRWTGRWPPSGAVYYLGVCTKRAKSRHSDEGKALIEVLVGGAALQESKGDEVELPFQNQDQLPVPAHRAT